MHPNEKNLETRVHRAAEAALFRQHYVSPIDVLCGMGLLTDAHVGAWRKGRVDFLERVIQGNLKKISTSNGYLSPLGKGEGTQTKRDAIHTPYSKRESLLAVFEEWRPRN